MAMVKGPELLGRLRAGVPALHVQLLTSGNPLLLPKSLLLPNNDSTLLSSASLRGLATEDPISSQERGTAPLPYRAKPLEQTWATRACL